MRLTFQKRTAERLALVLSREVSQPFAQWTASTAVERLGMLVVPGDELILTRDFLMYPEGHFLDIGILGIMGVALKPRKIGWFVDGVLANPAFISKRTLQVAAPVFEVKDRFARKYRMYMRSASEQLKFLFNEPGGKENDRGKRMLDRMRGWGVIEPLPGS